MEIRPVPGFKTKMLRSSLIMGLLASIALNLSAETETPNWKKVRDKKGIQVYTAHTDASKIKSFKGVSTMPLDDIRVLVALVLDHGSLSSWLHFISRISLVESDYNRITEDAIYRRLRIETLLPWPVKDRDIIADLVLTQDESFAITGTVTVSPYNPPAVKGYIRIPQIDGVFMAEPVPDTGDVTFTYQMLLDPGGYVPAWMLNIIIADLPYYTMKKLKRTVQLEKHIEIARKLDNFKERPWLVSE